MGKAQQLLRVQPERECREGRAAEDCRPRHWRSARPTAARPTTPTAAAAMERARPRPHRRPAGPGRRRHSRRTATMRAPTPTPAASPVSALHLPPDKMALSIAAHNESGIGRMLRCVAQMPVTKAPWCAFSCGDSLCGHENLLIA
jgi:hypothetical protein